MLIIDFRSRLTRLVKWAEGLVQASRLRARSLVTRLIDALVGLGLKKKTLILIGVRARALRLLSTGDWESAHYLFMLLKSTAFGLGEEKNLVKAGLYISGTLRSISPQITNGAPGTVVYSANLGGYDDMLEHAWIYPGAEYSVFSDGPGFIPTYSDVHLPEYRGRDHRNTARWHKSHPHTLFPDKDWAVWMDANVVAKCDWSAEFEAFRASGRALGAIKHPLRTNISEEIQECGRLGKERVEILHEPPDSIRSFDKDGLWETNLLFFNLRNEKLRFFLDEWWRLIESWSNRDQISFPVAAEQAGLEPWSIFGGSASLRSHDDWFLVPHDLPAVSRAIALTRSQW